MNGFATKQPPRRGGSLAWDISRLHAQLPKRDTNQTKFINEREGMRPARAGVDISTSNPVTYTLYEPVLAHFRGVSSPAVGFRIFP